MNTSLALSGCILKSPSAANFRADISVCAALLRRAARPDLQDGTTDGSRLVVENPECHAQALLEDGLVQPGLLPDGRPSRLYCALSGGRHVTDLEILTGNKRRPLHDRSRGFIEEVLSPTGLGHIPGRCYLRQGASI
jgi:hypothetical protein